MMKLGKFEILSKIGQGAMGVVYKARDPFIGRVVALKTITTGLAESPDLLKRFYGEAQSAGRLQHPNIVTIFELGNEGNTPFIAMEFLSGESLDKLIARHSKLPLSQKLGYIVSVCRALEYAHRQNPSVIHRDIKPGNVMVTSEGAVKVVDFGIARLGEGSHTQSKGMLIGTFGYMSPQQFRGGSADARSDIWATGIMLYELLCYHRPFDADNPGALMTSIMMDPYRPITEEAPGTPAEVQAIIDRMLCKDLDGRYQSMDEVLLELEPVWHQVQQAEVSSLVADGRQRFEAKDLAGAESIVRKALRLDTSNLQAKSLLEKINAELRRTRIIQQVKMRVQNGQNLFSAGQFEEAKAEAEAALRLDSTFQPARELLDQAQAAAERIRLLATALRASKQRLAEGALTEAELQLDKVLQMDPANAAALELLQQIREEKARRERQARLAEALRRARTFWTNLQYEECISLLLEAEKEFPGESEISRLLSTAREDQAEQERQFLLSEARKLLSAQKFDETLQALDRLLKRFPSDPTAKNLRTLALQGQEQAKREQRLNENLKSLRAMVEKRKYQEAIESGQRVLQEFPDEFELVELIQFARSEQIQTEQKRRLEEWLKRIQQSVRDERFQVAVQDAQKALKEFPQDVELQILADRATNGLAEQKRENLLRQRLQEVENRIERQEFTEAIDLARETLVTVGPHSGLANLLHRAEMELEQRNARRRVQDEALEQARTLLEAGKFGDATVILENAVETKLFAKSDPRFASLAIEIDAKKQQRRLEDALKELRTLLADRRHKEVIDKGEALLGELPQDVELRELVEFARAEISREQQRQKERECEEEIRSLIRSGRFVDAQDAAVRAANAYPKQSSFRRLLEEARSKKREQDERERLRQEIERKKEDQRRKEEQEHRVEAVRTVIEKGNFAEATELLSRAIADKVLDHSGELVRQLESEIEEKKRREEERREEQRKRQQAQEFEEKKKREARDREEQRKKQLAQELEKKRREAREALSRGDLSLALQIAREGQAASGSDAELADLARKAEAALEKERIQTRNRDELLERIREHVNSGNVSAASLLLNNSLKNGALKRSDIQVSALADKIKSVLDEEERKHTQLQQVTSKMQELIRKRRFPEALAAGRDFLSQRGFEEGVAELVKRAEIANAAEEGSQKRREGELQTVWGLLSEGKPREAKQVLLEALRQGVLPQGSEVKDLQKQIDAALKKQEKERLSTRDADAAAIEGPGAAEERKRIVLLAVAAVVLVAAGGYGIHLLFKKPPPPAPPPAVEAWFEQAREDASSTPHRYRLAKELLTKGLASRSSRSETQQEAQRLLQNVQSQIEREDGMMDLANQALRLRDCKNATQFFSRAIEINGDRLDEAKQGLEQTNDPRNCESDPTVLVQRNLEEADRAFQKNDLQRAKTLFGLVSNSPFATKQELSLARSRLGTIDKQLLVIAQRQEAERKNAETLEANRNAEESLWNQAVAAESDAGSDIAKLEKAKDLFQQVAAYGLAHKSLANEKVSEITREIARTNERNAANAKCTQDLTVLTRDFNGFKENRDSSNLTSLKGRLESFAKSSCSPDEVEQATSLASQIPSLVSSWQPPPSSPTAVDPRESDKRAVTELIEVQLSEAFRRRDINRIKALWPDANKTDLDKLREAFGQSKEFSRNCKISKWDFRGSNEVEVSGTYSGRMVDIHGQTLPLNGTFDIRVVQIDNGWHIRNITW
jgi:eukaryotic-like serine/threonine-protein kinase